MTNRLLPLSLLAAFLAVAGPALHARGDAFAVAGAKITASDRGANDELGFALDLDVDTLAAGAHLDIHNGIRSGSAYLFARNQGGAGAWGQTRKLVPADAAVGDRFGHDVAVRGNLAIVGAPLKAGGNGAAYIYDRNYPTPGAWGQVFKLTGAGGEQFGLSVDIDGEDCVVGAHYNDTKAVNAGAAYLFHRSGTGTSEWVQVKQLTASDGALDDEFGYDVAISGDTVVVGAPKDNASDPGSAYLFQRNQGGAGQWGQLKRIVSANSFFNDEFGTSVAIDGDRIAVGAPFQDAGTVDAGAAYLFERNQGGPNQWGQVAHLTSPDGALFDHLGTQVAISGELVLVGARDDDRTFLTDAGAACLFYRNQGGTATWAQVAKLTSADANISDHFGSAVAVGPATVMVGAANNNGGAVSSGSVYPFSLTFNNPPTIANQSFSVPENSPNGTSVGTVAAGAGDAGQGLTFAITSGNTGGAFAIGAAGGAISVANSSVLDYEALTQFLLGVRVVDNGTPPLTNSATVTVHLTDIPETTDLTVSKTASGSGRAGDPLTYFVTVRNLGPLVATNVVVTDYVPAGVSPPGNVVKSIGNLAAGQQHIFTIGVTVHSSRTAPLTNRVVAATDTPDANGANNAFTLVTPITPMADLRVTKTAPPRIDPGDAFAYTITVSNAGPSDAVGVYTLDTLPPGLTTSGVISNHLGLLTPGTSQVVQVPVESDGVVIGDLTNRVVVAAATADPAPANNSAQAVTTVNYIADVGIAKSGPVLITDTSNVLYRLTITNYGPSPATDVLITDTLPPGMTFNPAGSDLLCSGSGASLTCNLATLVPSGVVVLEVAAILAPTASGLVVNAATVSTTAIDSNPSNDLAEAVTLIPDFDGDGAADFADPDDDNDLIPDAWETPYGMNRYDPTDAGEDPDSDGFSSLQEYIADTVPTNGLSYLSVTAIDPAALVFFSSSSNRFYSLEYTDHLPPGAWLPAQTNVPGTGGPQIIGDPNAAPIRHYRIRAHLP